MGDAVKRYTESTIYRIRVFLFLTIVLTVIGGAVVLLQGIAALLQLGPIERERDSWQKPAEVLQALDLHQGTTVVDLGCGSGYFTLKLSPLLGNRGRVLAVDIRREPLIFLWIRSLVLPAHNVSIIHGQANDANLGFVRLDAALISNTYHELRSPLAILGQLHRSLRHGGRLVVVDRGPEFSSECSPVRNAAPRSPSTFSPERSRSSRFHNSEWPRSVHIQIWRLTLVANSRCKAVVRKRTFTQ